MNRDGQTGAAVGFGKTAAAPHRSGAHQVINTIARFWSKVDHTDDPSACWIWMSTTSIHGYGRFKVEGKMVAAHRYSYELAYGELPTNRDICHTCNNRRCVNPAHLYAGTEKQNVADAIRAGTHHNFHKTKTGGEKRWKGSETTFALLSEQEVLEIYRRIQTGETQRALATEFGVSKTTIADIWSGRSWGWLTKQRSGSDLTQHSQGWKDR